MLGTYHMSELLEALKDLHHFHERHQLYQFILDRCGDVLKAQGGTYYAVKEETEEMIPEASRGVDIKVLREIPFKMTTGIAGWVATTKKALNVDNAQADKRFNRAVDVVTGVKTRSVICVPIVRKERILGIVELVNRTDGIFRDPDFEFLQQLCAQVGVAIENCTLLEETQELLAYTNSVINSLTGGFLSTDGRGSVTRCNNAACRILGITADEVLKKPLLEALPQYPAFAAILDVTLKREAPVARQEIELQKPHGGAMLIGYSTFLIRDDNQKLLGAAITFLDLSNLKKK
ncbi:MAG: GAF domain-containing protein [Elusimicrobia bacterium]|nr:GAF domain-containing protein [Candidatus Obscuribacterium magneticum]